MEKVQVTSIRDNFHGLANKANINLINDNMILSNEHSSFIVFDDTNELVYMVKPNTGRQDLNTLENPAAVYCGSYDTIQYMFGNLTLDQLEEFLTKTKANGAIITDEQIKMIVDKFKMIVKVTSEEESFIGTNYKKVNPDGSLNSNYVSKDPSGQNQNPF